MKPLPIKGQIRILRKVLQTPFLRSMCAKIYYAANNLRYNIDFTQVIEIIPTFNHAAYLEFYPNIKAVQERNTNIFWDSHTLFGRLRRRWFIRHLIKELKKQL